MDKRVVEWSDLPRELLPMIGKNLDARVDVLRFRSVCTSWRSSIPPFHAHSPLFPVKFPDPRSALQSASMSRPPVYLCESTLYLLQPVNPFPNSTSSSCNRGWLIKVQESKSGKSRLLDLLPIHKYWRPPFTLNTLNLLNFRVVELRKAYMLRFHVPTPPRSETERDFFLGYRYHRPIPWVNKVVMFPSSASSDADESAVFVIFHGWKLGFAKCGDEKLTLVGDRSIEFDDIIVYKGQLYVVDKLGIVWWIECSSLKLVPFSPPLCGLGHQKHLVESCGALYVVDRYLDREGRRVENNIRHPNFPKTVDFKVYMLDEEEEGGWILLKSLGDRAFVLGNDCCFSVSAQELVGCKGNCIYFIDQHESRIFSLDDHSIGDLASSMEDDSHPFWEAPTWLSSANPLP